MGIAGSLGTLRYLDGEKPHGGGGRRDAHA